MESVSCKVQKTTWNMFEKGLWMEKNFCGKWESSFMPKLSPFIIFRRKLKTECICDCKGGSRCSSDYYGYKTGRVRHQQWPEMTRCDPEGSWFRQFGPALGSSLKLRNLLSVCFAFNAIISMMIWYIEFQFWFHPVKKCFPKGIAYTCMYSLLYLIYAFRNSRALGVKNSQIWKGWPPSDELRF